MTKHDLLVFVPTYNEKDNVQRLYEEIKKHVNADILFCDDNSPDGTGAILDMLAHNDARVKVIHRPEKQGLGTAHIQAFMFARQHQYRYLLTMDADFTHHPSFIPALCAQRDSADVIIGSRYASGGGMSGWGPIRLRFTYLWRNLIKYGLGMPYDCTGAFRLYDVAKLQPDFYLNLNSQGFSFCIESLFYLHHGGARITEVPIHAHNRVQGKSKLSGKIMREGARTFLKLYFKKRKK